MKTCLSIFITVLGLVFGSSAFAQPQVAVSIKPLQLIAAAIQGDTAEPALLAPSSASPHDHALRPSGRALLEDADILLWVGPELEVWLERVAAEVDALDLRAAALPGLALRETGGGLDPHVWLDPANARLTARALAEALAALDPANAGTYEANLGAFEAELDRLDDEIRAKLNEADPAPYAVYHDAFGYFEARYGLAHVAAFTRNEEVLPGIRQLLEIRGQLESAGVRCILIEPGVNVAHLRNVVEIEAMRYVEVDALGNDVALSPAGYPALLRGVADSVLNCLERE